MNRIQSLPLQSNSNSLVKCWNLAYGFKVLVSVFLLVAALLKTLMLVEPSWIFANTVWAARANMLIIVCECGLASILLSNVLPKHASLAAAVVFLLFSYYQGSLILNGIYSCACLGVIQANPKVMLLVDTLIALTFFFFFCTFPSQVKSQQSSAVWGFSVLAITLLSFGTIYFFGLGGIEKETRGHGFEQFKVGSANGLVS